MPDGLYPLTHTGTKLVQRPKQQALPVATGNQQQQQACVGDMPPPQPQPQPGAKQPAGSAPAGLLQLSPPLAALVQMLDDLWQLVDETPPVSQSLRYGNPAYRTWSAAMCEHAPGWLAQVLPPELSSASVELLPYLLDSFGNATRIDYGTGSWHCMPYLLLEDSDQWERDNAVGLPGIVPDTKAAYTCICSTACVSKEPHPPITSPLHTHLLPHVPHMFAVL